MTAIDHDAVARLAIADLVARYCDAVARADQVAFASCWAADAEWTGPGLDRTGRPDIVRAWAKMRARFTVALQGVVSGRVQVLGATATGTWWIRELLVPVAGPPRETVGRYDDEYGYDADPTSPGWCITRRAFTPVGPAGAVRPGAPAAT
ncbi:MAG: nuclear transport factor 2 family protein [Actinobacteria bacterium]|nr:nuclear transport factor 2 family protein [Actinomycetota bacterium]